MNQKRTPMNPKPVTLAVAAVLFCGVSGGTFAASDTATITITGRVLANTCTIDSGSAKQNVTLSDIADRDIKGAGKTGGEKQISIVLKECGPVANYVTVTASGNPDGADTTAFANSIAQEDAGATGVALYFYQTDGSTKFKPDGSVTEKSTLTPSQDNTLAYKVAYVGTKDVVTAGSFSTVVNMKFEYQ
ncbi:fimbrial protein [Serratia quinivorans]|uniref:fimbrial protein n=1 Tax=Serratia quinivorans TaxID=137545 RepID=UPI003982249A